MNQEKIGEFITKLRKEKKWTQEDLAQKLLVDRTMISKWERGLYIPNVEYLLQLQKLFNESENEINSSEELEEQILAYITSNMEYDYNISIDIDKLFDKKEKYSEIQQDKNIEEEIEK